MFFLEKLSSTGKAIYFSGISIAVIALVIVTWKFPESNKMLHFGVFAGIWMVTFFIASQFKKK